MRVVFMGTPDFAVPSLTALTGAHEVVAVYTRPDAVSGRGGTRHPSAVKRFAESAGIGILQPHSLRDSDQRDSLARLTPDVVVVAAYGLILPAAVLQVPPLGCVNVHASLLPRWRGAAPVHRAILAGDEVTGVSIMRMEEGLDTGPYCETVSVAVDEKNAVALTQELAERGADALMRVLDRMRAGDCVWTPQDEDLATYAEKITKADVALSPDLGLEAALRRVRASSPQAPARVIVGDRGMTIMEASTYPERLEPGATACTRNTMLLGFSDGTMSATRVKPDGKGEMLGCDWMRGSRLAADTSWIRAR